LVGADFVLAGLDQDVFAGGNWRLGTGCSEVSRKIHRKMPEGEPGDFPFGLSESAFWRAMRGLYSLMAEEHTRRILLKLNSKFYCTVILRGVARAFPFFAAGP
jgi:hypothetical protein